MGDKDLILSVFKYLLTAVNDQALSNSVVSVNCELNKEKEEEELAYNMKIEFVWKHSQPSEDDELETTLSKLIGEPQTESDKVKSLVDELKG